MPFKVPGVWAEDNPPGLAVNIPPVAVEIKPGVTPIRVRQYPIPMRTQKGIAHHLQRLLNYGSLRPCQSAWNTPLLPVQKPGTNDYHPVQDLQAVNQAAVTLHPVVPNPYTLLALIPAEATCFSCLDFKDAFFCIQLAPVSQPIFAFQWEDLQSGGRQQLTWTQLPQGFKNSTTIFGTALTPDLQAYPAEEADCTLLQYVGDLLLTVANHQDYLKGKERYEKLDTKYPKRQPKSAKTKSNIWGSTSPKAHGTLVQKNKTSCPLNPNSDYKKTDP
jgi:hypothetical protein